MSARVAETLPCGKGFYLRRVMRRSRVVGHALRARRGGQRTARPTFFPSVTDALLRRHFQRVLLQDSTVLPLPDRLAQTFPGSRNQHRKKKAAALLGLSVQRLLEFSLHRHIFYEQRPDRSNFYQLRAAALG